VVIYKKTLTRKVVSGAKVAFPSRKRQGNVEVARKWSDVRKMEVVRTGNRK